jgi:hypothetical protein
MFLLILSRVFFLIEELLRLWKDYYDNVEDEDNNEDSDNYDHGDDYGDGPI